MIIVIQTAFLGDLILSVPAILRIRKNFPGVEVGVVCKKGLGSFLIESKVCDQVFEIEKGNRDSYKINLKKINRNPVRAVFCFHRSMRSQLLALQINTQKKFGFKSWLSNFVFDGAVAYVKSWPDVVRYMSLIRVVDSELNSYFEKTDPVFLERLNFKTEDGRFLPTPDLFQFPRSLTAKPVDQNKVVLFPGSVWATKKWTQEGFVELVKSFKEKNIKVFLLGSPQEQELCNEICNLAGYGSVKAGEFNIAQSIDFISDAQFVVCNDSASAHMAAFVNRPAIVIFGPTTLALGFRPWNDESRVVEMNLDCRPCGAHGHDRCPLGHHRCMVMIKSNDVLAQITSAGLLNKFSV